VDRRIEEWLKKPTHCVSMSKQPNGQYLVVLATSEPGERGGVGTASSLEQAISEAFLELEADDFPDTF